jgi:hypothetical protein
MNSKEACRFGKNTFGNYVLLKLDATFQCDSLSDNTAM